MVKLEADLAREQNDFLQGELRRTEEENADYEAYMAKKMVREQDKVSKLSDAHQLAVDAVERCVRSRSRGMMGCAISRHRRWAARGTRRST